MFVSYSPMTYSLDNNVLQSRTRGPSSDLPPLVTHLLLPYNRHFVTGSTVSPITRTVHSFRPLVSDFTPTHDNPHYSQNEMDLTSVTLETPHYTQTFPHPTRYYHLHPNNPTDKIEEVRFTSFESYPSKEGLIQ